MSALDVSRDERTVAIENAGHRWSFRIMSFGLLIAAAYRSLARHEGAWDLLGLVIIGGFVSVGYQWAHRVLNRRWVVATAVTIAIAALLGALLTWLRVAA